MHIVGNINESMKRKNLWRDFPVLCPQRGGQYNITHSALTPLLHKAIAYSNTKHIQRNGKWVALDNFLFIFVAEIIGFFFLILQKRSNHWVLCLCNAFCAFPCDMKPYKHKHTKYELKLLLTVETRELWKNGIEWQGAIGFPVCRLHGQTERKAKVIPWPSSVIAVVVIVISMSSWCPLFSLSIRLYNTPCYLTIRQNGANKKALLKQMENAIYTILNANEWRQRVFLHHQHHHRRRHFPRSIAAAIATPTPGFAILFHSNPYTYWILLYCCTTFVT